MWFKVKFDIRDIAHLYIALCVLELTILISLEPISKIAGIRVLSGKIRIIDHDVFSVLLKTRGLGDLVEVVGNLKKNKIPILMVIIENTGYSVQHIISLADDRGNYLSKFRNEKESISEYMSQNIISIKEKKSGTEFTLESEKKDGLNLGLPNFLPTGTALSPRRNISAIIIGTPDNLKKLDNTDGLFVRDILISDKDKPHRVISKKEIQNILKRHYSDLPVTQINPR